MMIPFKKAPILGGFRAKLPVHQGISGTILTGLVVAWALVIQVWAIDPNSQATHSVPTAQATNGMPDLGQLTRDLHRFVGGAQAAAAQRGAGPKALANTVKDPISSAQPTWWVTAAENGAARQIKRVGKPIVTSPVQAKAKRTDTETMQLVQSFLSSQSSSLKLRDPNAELALVSSETDSLGYRHLRYTQKLEEIPVWPTGLTVHLAPDGELHLVTASIVPTPSAVSRIPAIDADKAVERAKAKIPGGFRGTHTTPELILHWDSDAPATPVRLAWKFRVSVGEHASWTAIMDAHTGGEVSIQSDARSGSVTGSGTDLFGVTKTFPVWEQGGVYYMIDTTKPSYNGATDPFVSSANGMIVVLDYNGGVSSPNFVSSQSRNNWVPPESVSVHSMLGSIYDYYFKEHGRNGLSGLGDAMPAFVRYGDPKWFNNAFYSGRRMFFGVGNNSTAKCLDIVAHEFTHGVVECSNAKLEYVNQSGALNEAFADIFGEMVELFVKGTNDWLIGFDSGKVARSMSDPGSIKISNTSYVYPARMSEFWTAEDPRLEDFDKKDNGGVHFNSSILNKSYYTLAKTISPKVSAKIFYRCLMQYLKPQSKFVDCRIGCVNAAEDLYPLDPSIKKAVEAAFDSVEIYDGNPTPAPGDFPPVNAADSYLVLFSKSNQSGYSLARREEAQMDHFMQSYTKIFESVSRAKPVVSGDGTEFVFVTSDGNLGLTATLNPVVDLKTYGMSIPINSVAIAPDGSGFALVLRDSNRVILWQSKTGVVRTNQLYSPGSEGVFLDNIKKADVVSFSPDGRFLVYDAAVPSTDGSNRDWWSIYLMDVATGQVWHLINSGADYDVGNPAFGHTSNNFITYERINRKTGVSTIMVYDQFMNRHGEIATVNGFGFPEFNGDDAALVFSDTDSSAKATGRSLFKVKLDKNRQLVAGTRALAIQEASMAVVYRRGAYRTTNEPPTITWTNPAPGSSVALGASVTLAVSAVDQDGIDRVEFWQGGRKLGELLQPPFALSVPMPQVGTFSVVARAYDSYGASADSTPIQFSVVSPLFSKISDQAVDEGSLLRLDLGSAVGTKPGVSFSLVSGPSGLSLSPPGVLTWTPTEDQGPSAALVEVAATDGTSRMTDRFTVQVREVNQPPILSSVPTLNAKAGVELNYALQGSDPDRPAQALSFALESGPSGLTVSTVGAVRWTPTVTQISTVQSVTVSVSDGALKATTQFLIQVSGDVMPVSPTNVVWSVDGIAGNFIETPDGNLVAGGNGSLRCFSGDDGKEVWSFGVSDTDTTASWQLLPGYIDDDKAIVGKYKRVVLNPVYSVNHGVFVLERIGGVSRFTPYLISTNTDYNSDWGLIRGLRHRELMLQSLDGVGVYEIGKGFKWLNKNYNLIIENRWVPLKDFFIATYTQSGVAANGLAAYNYSDGSVRWVSWIPGASSSVRQLLTDGVNHIFLSNAETAHAVDAFTGQVLWKTGNGSFGEDSLVVVSSHKTLDRYYYFRGQSQGYGEFIDIRNGYRYGVGGISDPGRLSGYSATDSAYLGGMILSNGSRILALTGGGTNVWPGLPNGENLVSVNPAGQFNWVIPRSDIYYVQSVLQNGRILVSGYTGGKLMALQGEGAGLSTASPWPHRLRTTPRFGNYGVLGLGSADSGLTSLYSFDGHADDLVSACDAPEGAVGTAGFAASGGPRRGYLKPDRGVDTRFDSGFMRTNSSAKSLTAWVRLPDVSSSPTKLLDCGDEDPTGFAGLNLTASIAASGTQLTFNLGAGTSASWQAVSAISQKRSRQWVHVAAVLNDSGVQQLYLDGVLAATAVGRSTKAISRASTAAMQLPAAVGFDDLRTYLRAVTADEVAQIYAAADPMVEPPVIVAPPVASSVNAGGTVAFSVVATGTAPLSYQWRRSGVALVGETNATLTLTRVEAASAGDYTVVVSNSAGSATSSVATLTVNTPPQFVGLQPTSVAEGSELSVPLATADSDLPAQKLTVRLLSGPTGLVVSSQGLVSWIPTEAQGPATYPVVVEVSDGSISATNQFNVSVLEVNRPPAINSVSPSSIAEGQTWIQPLTVSDPDLPANALSFRLISGPSGSSLDTKTGVLRWAPTEADGGRDFEWVIEVKDDGQPPLSSQASVRLSVLEVNDPPSLAPLADVALPEGQAWTLTVRGMDNDVPAQTLTYGLKNAPAGMTMNGQSGEIRWVPSEAQGPGTYPVTVTVTDSSGAVGERSFVATVTEVNQPPQVVGWTDQRIVLGQSVSLKMQATDADLPANALTYRVVSGPTNGVLDNDGVWVWKPNRNQAPSTNLIQIAVSDGTVSVTNSVQIEVFELVMAVNGVEVMEAVMGGLNSKISFRCGRPDWLVYYSLNGQAPTYDLPSKFYQDPFVLPATATVWPIAFSPDFSDSVVGIPVRVSMLKAQNLTLEGGLGLTHQGPGVAVTGRSDSGLPVTLIVVSGPGRLEAGQLIPTGGGVIRIRLSQAGDQNWSPAVAEIERVVARAAQTVAWQPVGQMVYGANPVRLNATATSGLPVEYTVLSGPASVSGDQLQVTGAGSVMLRARQAGNADFEAAAADLSVPVSKASQTLVWDGVSDRSFSSETILLNAQSSSGLSVTYEVVSGPAAVTNDRLALIGVGTVVIRASQAGNANYEAAPVRQVSFVVSKAAQTLIFGSVGSKTFGDGPLTLSATSSAGLPVTYRVLSGPGSLVGNQLSLTGAGEVVIRASQAGNDLYQALSVDQNVTVAKAAQSLSWGPESSLTYRTNLIALEAKASSGLPVSYRVVSGPGSIVAGQLSLTGVGSVLIAAEQDGNANWLAAAAITNRFVVGRGVQVVTFEPIADQTLGAGPLTLFAIASSGLPVTFSVINGPATVDHDRLTLSGEGVVTVRAINPGSPLWLSASVDQSFRVVTLGTPPQVVINQPTGDGAFGLEIRAPAGINLALETTSDLSAWTETQRIVGQGSGNPVTVTLKTDPNVQAKFWRVRVR